MKLMKRNFHAVHFSFKFLYKIAILSFDILSDEIFLGKECMEWILLMFNVGLALANCLVDLFHYLVDVADAEL